MKDRTPANAANKCLLEDVIYRVYTARYEVYKDRRRVIYIVFLPATLIASIWGMNVGLPGGGDPSTSSTIVFCVILAAMVAFVAGMLAYFRHKRWL